MEMLIIGFLLFLSGFLAAVSVVIYFQAIHDWIEYAFASALLMICAIALSFVGW